MISTIPTLEILEESLLEYRGVLVMVTHGRHMTTGHWKHLRAG